MNNSTLHLMATVLVAQQAGQVMKDGGDPADFAALLAAAAAIARHAALSSAKPDRAARVDQRIAELVTLVTQTNAEVQKIKESAS